MALPTFIPPCAPSPGLTDTPELKINRSEFGEGYQQSTRAGLNHIRRVIEATWDVLERAERDQIIAFFKERGGDRPFVYAFPHDASPTKWTVDSWSDTIIGGDYHKITATFRQSFTLLT